MITSHRFLATPAAIAGVLLGAVLASRCGDGGTSPARLLMVTGVNPDRGPLAGGTVVTISGTSFVDITGVTIGGAALGGVTVVSATEITGTTPPGTTTGAQDVMVTSSSRGTGGCTACFIYTQFPGPLALRLSGAPPDSSRAPGALLMRVDGGPVSAITASGPAVRWASTAATPAHVIVSGALTPGMSLATLVVPDTQESVRRRYSVAVVQVTTARGTGYRQLNPTDYVVSITPVGP
jgi:hypothetical protein